MANVKITQLPTATSIEDNDLVAVVTGMDSTPTTEHITKFDFAASIASSPLATNPVENTYADIASMLADQANQTTNFFQFVLDATADPNITIGSAYYEKLASTTATLSLDYRLLSQSEAEVIEGNQAYKTFTIEAIQDDATPLTTVAGGRISFEYSGADVTAILFNKEYTTALGNFYGSDVNINFYNRTTKTYQKESIATAGWTTVNTDYARGAVAGASIQIANLTVGDSIDFSVSQSSGSGGATAEWGGITGTLSSQVDLQAELDAKQGDITLTTTGTSGASTFDGTTLNVPIYPSGVGDVIKVGTPENNQIGVWTGDGTIEGDSSILVDASSVTINPAIIDNAIISVNTSGEARVFGLSETRIESNLFVEFGTPITDGIADTMQIDVAGRTVTLLSYTGGISGTALYSLSIDSTGKIITTPISLESVVAGTNITIDATDPSNPIINATGGSGIGGTIADNQIAFGSSTADEIEGSSSLTWNGTQFDVAGANSTNVQLSQGQLSLIGTFGQRSFLLAPSTNIMRYASGFNLDLAFPSTIATSNKVVTLKDETGTVALLSDTGVGSTATGEPTGSDVVVNMVSLTQAEYDAGTPVATTFYVITD